MKSDVNDNGSYKWIPISPIDADEISGEIVPNPYETLVNPLSGSSDKMLDQVLKIILNRFYILSQYVYSNNFYAKNKSIFSQSYAKSEAMNLAYILQMFPQHSSNIKSFCDGINNSVDNFYNYLNN